MMYLRKRLSLQRENISEQAHRRTSSGAKQQKFATDFNLIDVTCTNIGCKGMARAAALEPAACGGLGDRRIMKEGGSDGIIIMKEEGSDGS